MKIRHDTNELRSRHDIRDIAERFTVLNKHGQGPCPSCGGEDRFFITKDQRFGCRVCKSHGDVIDLIRLANPTFSFVEAVEYLEGRALPPKQPGQVKPLRNRPALPEGQWLKSASEGVARFEAALIDPSTPEGLAYFVGRGLTIETCKAFRVGYSPKRDAVTLPHIGSAGEIFAVKYRSLATNCDPRKRYTAAPGSRPGLFGRHLQSGSRVVFVIEGEINAMSLYQALQAFEVPPDVLSVGSESADLVRLVKELVRLRYSKVIAWFDREERAREAGEAIGQKILCHSLKSPDLDGRKWDANDLLKAGYLDEILLSQLPGLRLRGDTACGHSQAPINQITDENANVAQIANGTASAGDDLFYYTAEMEAEGVSLLWGSNDRRRVWFEGKVRGPLVSFSPESARVYRWNDQIEAIERQTRSSGRLPYPGETREYSPEEKGSSPLLRYLEASTALSQTQSRILDQLRRIHGVNPTSGSDNPQQRMP